MVGTSSPRRSEPFPYLRKRGIDVLVPTVAVKELPNSNLQEILNAWKNKGVKLITTKEVKNYLV